jgi:hypothetical protein
MCRRMRVEGFRISVLSLSEKNRVCPVSSLVTAKYPVFERVVKVSFLNRSFSGS